MRKEQIQRTTIITILKAVEAMLITLLLFPALIRLAETPLTIVLCWLVPLIGSGLTSHLARRKRYVATIFMIGYLDIFGFDPTSIEERDGETLS